ncbi:MAG: ABC transporter ATP-binding protein [Eubacteriales bacterium]
MAYFEINNLVITHHTYEGTHTVLDIPHLEIAKGETYGLVGESGQGKTVLALAIQKLLRCPPGEIVSGEILLDGENLLDRTEKTMQKSIRGTKIAMIFQDPMSCLNPVFTVGSIMVDVLRRSNPKVGKKVLNTMALSLLDEVKLPDGDSILAKYPHQLSGGQRQRVIIALALACGAEFLIADEPTRNLDVTIQASILKLLKEIQRKHHMTVLFIANNLSLVSAFCDRVGVLHNSQLVEQNTTAQLVTNPQHDYTKLLLEAVSAHRPTAVELESAEPLLRVENLKKYFDINDDLRKLRHQTLKAVDNVTFTLNKGEVLGIVGESGCGKSTLVNTILNLFAPTEGKVFFEGVDVFANAKGSNNAFKKNVQIVFQDPYWSLNPRWMVKDIVAEPIDVYERFSASQRIARVEELLEMVGLSAEQCYRYPHEFSGGQRQRIAIARSLASNPKLVVLDEPTSSIDVFSQAQILELIKDLREKLGLTNILISHDLGVVQELANKIAIMYLGKVVEFGKAEEIFENPRHPYTKALFNSIPKLTTQGMDSLQTLEGQIPSPINPPPGCAFHQRCSMACQRCGKETPPEVDLGNGHMVRCFLAEKGE